jgi:tRNA-Thr(GGU) m(6)t(6)A37 methyltransferase TsaA
MELKELGRITRRSEGAEIRIDEVFRPALKDLDGFTHAVVLWWAHEMASDEWRSKTTTEVPYADSREMGIFATRAQYRPNPIGITVVKIEDLDMEEGRLIVNDIDTLEGTPVLDIKPYYPCLDRVKDAGIPEYIPNWGDWYPDSGIGFYEDQD